MALPLPCPPFGESVEPHAPPEALAADGPAAVLRIGAGPSPPLLAPLGALAAGGGLCGTGDAGDGDPGGGGIGGLSPCPGATPSGVASLNAGVPFCAVLREAGIFVGQARGSGMGLVTFSGKFAENGCMMHALHVPISARMPHFLLLTIASPAVTMH